MTSHLKQQIQERMEAEHLTIYSLEKKAGLRRSAVRNILHGFSKNPSIEILQAIARALNCTVDELIGPTTDHPDMLPISARKSIPKSKTSHPWKEVLYLDAVRIISTLASERGLELSFEQIMHCVQEAYYYTLSKPSDTLDVEFCKWLMNRR